MVTFLSVIGFVAVVAVAVVAYRRRKNIRHWAEEKFYGGEDK